MRDMKDFFCLKEREHFYIDPQQDAALYFGRHELESRLAARGGSGRFGGGQKCVVYGLGKRKGLLQFLAIPC
jgi:acyl transferase domain-containing protein